MKPKKGDCLLIVDMQNDFMPWGSLPVPDADKIIPVLNSYIEIFSKKGLPVFASRDWHPPNHCSFKENGGKWPSHCVQHTEGAEFAKGLILPKETVVISKATTPEKEAYSALQDTELADLLRQNHINRCFVGGVATEYCVLSTVLDLLDLGYETYVLKDAIKAVNINPGDEEKALEEMRKKGALFITKESLV
jgi:nicotinamidase/pyrazinamidase